MNRPESGSIRLRVLRTLIALCCGFCAAISLPAASPDGTAGGRRLNARHPETMHSLRWRGVTRQAYDYSCGTGSIANLISLIGGQPPDEQTLIKKYSEMRAPKEVEQAMIVGFSLLDLKRMMGLLGYKTSGVRYESGTMPEEAQPMIVYLVVKGYRHFSVFAGTENGQVVLLDPARGRIRLSVERFLAEWDGSALSLVAPDAIAKLPSDQDSLTRAQETARTGLFRGH